MTLQLLGRPNLPAERADGFVKSSQLAHVHAFQLDVVRPAKIDGIVRAAVCVRILSGRIGNRTSPQWNPSGQLVELLFRFNVEANVVKPGCIDLKRNVLGRLLLLPDVQSTARDRREVHSNRG